MPNMKQIARLAKVSTATVSHVLSGKKPVREETRRRVEEAIRETDYTLNTIAKSLRMNKTQTIGVLAEDIRGLPVPEIVTGISEYLEKSGYQLLLNNLRLLEKLYNQYYHINMCQEEINRGMKVMTDAHVDGIIYVAMHDRWLEGINMPVDKPIVYAYSMIDAPEGLYVTYDNISSAAAVTRLLIEKGHRRIAVIAGHKHSEPSRQRLQGFQKAMAEAGLPVPETFIRWADWEWQSAAAETEALLLLSEKPTAIFAMNDLMAAGCYQAVRRHGLDIPTDISIAGFDNQDVSAHLYPSLTTVAMPTRQIGYESARILLEKIEDNKATASSMILPCSLCVRNSIGENKPE